MRATALGLLLAVTACNLNLEGAKCRDDTNCPQQQRCDLEAQRCVSCVADSRCAEDGVFCSQDRGAVLTCRTNAGSCRYLATERSCTPAPKVCVAEEGSATCGCPSRGNGAGQGCSSGDTNRCDPVSKEIVQCVKDEPTGCSVWQLASGATCASQQLVCGGDPGAAACVCAPSSGTLYVDPMAGSDASGATGAQAPARCRFKKLGAALAAAASGTTVAMTGWSSSAGPVTFAGEQMPLMVKAGVTLKGDDAAADRYVVEVDRAEPNRPAVQLEHDAIASGFTIQPTGDGSASSAVLVNCTTPGNGVATVANLLLDGKGTRPTAGIDYGVRLEGGCGVEVSGLTVRQMNRSGVYIGSSGSANVTLSNSRLEKNGDTGLQVRLESPEVTANIARNEIVQNEALSKYGQGLDRRAGGVLFYGTRPKSMAFTRNTIRGNKGDQILIYSGISGWTLQGGSDASACGNGSNVIACYDANGVGLSQVSSGSVDARFNDWGGGTSPPSAGSRDYFANGTASINVTGAGNDFCSTTAACP